MSAKDNLPPENHSAEWYVSSELAKCNRRLVSIIIVMAVVWAVSLPLLVTVFTSQKITFGSNIPQTEQLEKHEVTNEDYFMQHFFKDEWEEFIDNCDFTDDEMEVISYLRRGWYEVDIAEEVAVSVSTIKRRKKNIVLKISRYLAQEA